ncbi:MAG TPA: TRAP transporter fused permease subunit [Burkholderiales bacterium]|nr:TRAP transporter fused permease subunit [Burkholderiales bacterium]
MGTLITAGGIFWGLDVPAKLGWQVYQEQFIAAMLGLALAICYFRREDLLNFLLGGCGLLAGLWLAVRYPVLQADVLSHQAESLGLSIVLLALVLEACRRSAGVVLTLVFAFFFAWAMIGHHFPGMLQTKEVALARLLPYLALDTSSMLGTALIIASTTVIAFMFFGRVLQACGGGEFFTDISGAFFGRFRGGTGKVSVVASALFGTISGSAVANVMSTGVITIPNLKRAGYTPQIAGGVEAVSSTGGQIMPPVMGAAAFLMAENLQVRYAAVALAALLPAFLFYVSVFTQVDLEAARHRIGGIERSLLPRPGRVLRAGWFFVVPFVALFYLMFEHNMRAEESVLLGVAAMLPFAWLLGYGGKRLDLRGFARALAQTGADAVDLLIICAVAGAVIGLLNITGLSLGLSLTLVKLGEGNLPLLLLAVAVMCIILGMGLPTTGVYLLVAVLAAPPLIQLGVPPMAAHMFVFFYGCLSMITPPVAMAAFAAAHIAGAGPMRVALTACRLGWPAFVLPFLFAWSPTLLLMGPAQAVLVSVATAIAGVWLVSAALSGYLFSTLGPERRLAAGALGAVLLLPGHGYAGALYIQAAAVVAAAALVAWELRRANSRKTMEVA